MATRLTKKEKGFIEDYIETGNGTKSALNNYDTDSENVAASIASENLSKPKIIKAIKSIADSIPDELVIEKHLALLNREDDYGRIDSQSVSKGVDMAYKLKGSYAAERKDITIENIVPILVKFIDAKDDTNSPRIQKAV